MGGSESKVVIKLKSVYHPLRPSLPCVLPDRAAAAHVSVPALLQADPECTLRSSCSILATWEAASLEVLLFSLY